MDENRRTPRQRVLKSGKIIYDRNRLHDPQHLRDRRLRAPTSVAIPDRFEFAESTGRRRPATVVWRKGDLMGIRFDS